MTKFIELSEEERHIIIHQFLQIQETGLFNMLDFLSVQHYAFDNDMYEFVSFTENNPKNYYQILENIS